MAHLTARSEYRKLIERINRFPQGAPPSRLLYEILALLFSREEAELVAALPLRPFTAARAAQAWGVPEAAAAAKLQTLADKALLVDLPLKGQMHYVLPPPMAGFFEFALMRVRDDIDQKLLAELYEQYVSVEEDFIKALLVPGRTQAGRMLVQESVLSSEQALHVLDYEKATQIIDAATRYRRRPLLLPAQARPPGTRLRRTAGELPDPESRRRLPHPARRRPPHRPQRRARAAAPGERSQSRAVCRKRAAGGDASSATAAAAAARRCSPPSASATCSRSIPAASSPSANDACSGCGRCVPVCPVKVLSLEAEGANGFGRKRAVVDGELCLGCGVCARNCPRGALTMQRRAEKIITPVNGTHRVVLMAIERGKLQNLIFDQQILWNHRALAALLGVILKLPPVKRLLASEQVGSRYLGALCERYGVEANAGV